MTANSLIVLKGGLAVPLEPLRLAWALEHRGYAFRVEGDDLLVSPCDGLTADDWQRLRRWKPDLCALVAYCAQVEAV